VSKKAPKPKPTPKERALDVSRTLAGVTTTEPGTPERRAALEAVNEPGTVYRLIALERPRRAVGTARVIFGRDRVPVVDGVRCPDGVVVRSGIRCFLEVPEVKS
jgi:hypothetical protein